MKSMSTAVLGAIVISLGTPAFANTQSHNPAIKDSHPVTTDAPAQGANSFTEQQARGRITKAGYTAVSRLKKDQDGSWQGTAQKGHARVRVGLDYKGNVTVH
jgi:putative membrane protein